MGVFDALNTAVAGLQAQSFALQNISGNIANASTVGYKRTETSFVDLVTAGGGNDRPSGSVIAHARQTISEKGTISHAASATFMAIDGPGFFVVQKPSSFNGATPVFTGTSNYTRRGDFSLDKHGFLVNGAGYYIQGIPIDPITGIETGSIPQVLTFASSFVPAQATSTVSYQANLPKLPFTSNHNTSPSTPGSELLNEGGFTVNPAGTTAITPALAGTGTVIGTDVSNFISHSVNGGTITVFDPSGGSANLQLRWAKLHSTDPASGAAPHTDVWQLFYQVNSTATGGTVAWQNTNQNFTFVGNTLTPPVASVALGTPTIDGTTLGPVTISFGANGITQFSDSNGLPHVNQFQQDGFPAGNLQTVSVGDNGRVIGKFSNGREIALAKLSVATFTGQDRLTPLDGSAFAANDASGEPLFGDGGQPVGASLENSNADIADQFTLLIQTQQAFSANTKVITTANQMVNSLLRSI